MHVLKTSMAEREGDGEKVTKRDAAAAPVISDQEREWAQAALQDFTKGNYASCLQYLSKLEIARPQDTKVAHNKAVVEYYKSDLKKTDVFRKNMNMVCAQAHINIEDLDSLEDVEQCVIYFNQAVLLYHLKQYSSALKIMEKVFSFIEPMEETLAHRVCLLIVELHLCTQQPQKALRLIDYIENQFVSTDNAISSDKEIKPLEREHKEKKPVPVDAATDAFRLKLLQYRAKCYLMLRQVKACKRELKSLITSGGMTSTAVFLKSQLEYLRGNYKKAVKVLTSLPQNSVSFKDTGDNVGVYFYNNNGCIHHYMGKPNLACFYLQKALQENESAIRSLPKPEAGEPYSGRPLFTLGSNHSYELMYNLGVSLLHAKRPIQAFDCLTEAVQVYHMNSRLWLRLAECCIMAHKSGNEIDFNIAKRSKQLIQGILDVDSSSVHKKIILTPQLNSDTKYSSEGQGYAIVVASVEFASLCLRNALLTLPEVPAKSAENKEVGDQACFPAWPSTPMDAHAIASLRCSVVTASAYVSLCIGDHVMALEHAQALLAQPLLSGVHKMLGHLYASEALILRGDLDEALEHLDPLFANDLSMGLPSPDKEVDGATSEEQKPLLAWCPSNTMTAGAVLRYNMAVCLALGRHIEKAGEVLKEVWMSKSSNCDIPIHVIMLALYIEVTLRHTEVARSIIKQHLPECRYYRPPLPREEPVLSAAKLV